MLQNKPICVKIWFYFKVLITFSVRISVSREGAAAVIFDEGIALAISEEKSTADAPSQTTEN